MIGALNMELEIVRTVYRDSINEVGVYIDNKQDTGRYYTIVSILSKAMAKEIAARLAIGGLFSGNTDYIGSFTHKDALHLVFVYHSESRLMNREALYAPTFLKRKEIALNFLAALVEADMGEDIARLLITDENVNVTPGRKVYLNYFFRFRGFAADEAPEKFYCAAAEYAFGILSGEYEAKYEGHVESYPHELRLMYKKIQNKAFRSLSQIMTFIRTLPDKPAKRRFGVMRLTGVPDGIKSFVAKNSVSLFLAAVVLVTAGYLGYQVAVRVISDRGFRENVVYVGMRQIGEVYLGEENI